MNLQQVHVPLGHDDEQKTKVTAKALRWTITQDTLKQCNACTCVNAKYEDVEKESKKTSIPNKHM